MVRARTTPTAIRSAGQIRLAATGFTLVELIVVISIITLLVALLLPTLSKARDSANLSACLANQRQIGTAFRVYTTDYNDRLPWFTMSSNRGGGEIKSPGTFGPYTSTSKMGTGVLLAEEYLTDKRVLSDPGRAKHGDLSTTADYGVSWYAPVQLFDSLTWPPSSPAKAADWSPRIEELYNLWPRYLYPSGVGRGMGLMMACLVNRYTSAPAGNERPHRGYGNINGSANVLKMDSSVETLSDAFNPANIGAGGTLIWNERAYSGGVDGGQWWAWAHSKSAKSAP